MLNYGYYTAADADRMDIGKEVQAYTKRRNPETCGTVVNYHAKVHVKIIGQEKPNLPQHSGFYVSSYKQNNDTFNRLQRSVSGASLLNNSRFRDPSLDKLLKSPSKNSLNDNNSPNLSRNGSVLGLNNASFRIAPYDHNLSDEKQTEKIPYTIQQSANEESYLSRTESKVHFQGDLLDQSPIISPQMSPQGTKTHNMFNKPRFTLAPNSNTQSKTNLIMSPRTLKPSKSIEQLEQDQMRNMKLREEIGSLFLSPKQSKAGQSCFFKQTSTQLTPKQTLGGQGYLQNTIDPVLKMQQSNAQVAVASNNEELLSNQRKRYLDTLMTARYRKSDLSNNQKQQQQRQTQMRETSPYFQQLTVHPAELRRQATEMRQGVQPIDLTLEQGKTRKKNHQLPVMRPHFLEQHQNNTIQQANGTLSKRRLK